MHNPYIMAIDREKVQIGGAYLPVSDTYRKAFREFVERYQVGGGGGL